MKLLFFIGSLRAGGAERVCTSIVNELAKRGHNIFIVYNHHYPCQYYIDENIKQIDLSELIPKKGFKIYRKISYLYNIRRLTQQLRPDVVVSFMYSLNAIVLLSLIFSRYPVIASEHTRFQSLKDSNWRDYIFRYWINKLAKKVTVLTQRDYDFIGNRLSNKVVLPNPVSFESIKQIEPRLNRILACGSLDRYEEKGFDSLIEIFNCIALKYLDWELDILGTGSSEKEQELIRLIHKNHLECRVKLLGYSNDVASIMKQYPIFVLSSKFEGFSMVLIEAMSQGCACVSYDCVAGPREIINHNVDGLLIENQNKEALRNGIEYLIDNPNERIRLAQNAIKNVQRYSLNKIVDRWENLLEKCC